MGEVIGGLCVAGDETFGVSGSSNEFPIIFKDSEHIVCGLGVNDITEVIVGIIFKSQHVRVIFVFIFVEPGLG